jgi:protein-disulfide isomerase
MLNYKEGFAMFNDFICPHCEGHMMIAGHIIFAAVRKKDNKNGIILLDPKIGDYTSILHPRFKIDEGEEVDFLCPMCHESLTAYDVNQKLVRIIMIDNYSDKHDIFFSGIAGEHCTYKITGKSFEKVGDASKEYIQYFKLCDKYKDLL